MQILLKCDDTLNWLIKIPVVSKGEFWQKLGVKKVNFLVNFSFVPFFPSFQNTFLEDKHLNDTNKLGRQRPSIFITSRVNSEK